MINWIKRIYWRLKIIQVIYFLKPSGSFSRNTLIAKEMEDLMNKITTNNMIMWNLDLLNYYREFDLLKVKIKAEQNLIELGFIKNKK